MDLAAAAALVAAASAEEDPAAAAEVVVEAEVGVAVEAAADTTTVRPRAWLR